MDRIFFFFFRFFPKIKEKKIHGRSQLFAPIYKYTNIMCIQFILSLILLSFVFFIKKSYFDVKSYLVFFFFLIDIHFYYFFPLSLDLTLIMATKEYYKEEHYVCNFCTLARCFLDTLEKALMRLIERETRRAQGRAGTCYKYS